MIRSLFFHLFAIFGLAFWIGPQSATAATKEFLLKQATYSSAGGVFQSEVQLGIDDDATLTITVPEELADALVASIHANVPAAISRGAVANASVPISVRVEPKKAVKAVVRYTNSFGDSDPYHVGYEITQTDSAQTLNGFLRINDMSQADAKWSNAKLTIRRDVGNLELKVTMAAKQSTIVPIVSLQNYDVQIAAPVPAYIRLVDNQPFDILILNNGGANSLESGELRAVKDGFVLFNGLLPDDVSPQASGEILKAKVSEKVLKVDDVPAAERWHEAVELKDGSLTYKSWNIAGVKIENKSDSAIDLRIEDDQRDIVSKETIMLFPGTGSDSAKKTVDLTDLSEQTLKNNVEKLGELSVFNSSKASANEIEAIRKHLNEIHLLTKRINDLVDSKSAIVEKIDGLGSSEIEGQIEALVSRLKVVVPELEAANEEKTELTAHLMRLLYP